MLLTNAAAETGSESPTNDDDGIGWLCAATSNVGTATHVRRRGCGRQ